LLQFGYIHKSTLGLGIMAFLLGTDKTERPVILLAPSACSKIPRQIILTGTTDEMRWL